MGLWAVSQHLRGLILRSEILYIEIKHPPGRRHIELVADIGHRSRARLGLDRQDLAEFGEKPRRMGIGSSRAGSWLKGVDRFDARDLILALKHPCERDRSGGGVEDPAHRIGRNPINGHDEVRVGDRCDGHTKGGAGTVPTPRRPVKSRVEACLQ